MPTMTEDKFYYILSETRRPEVHTVLKGKMNNKFDFKTISSSQASAMGDLQRLLSQGEYPPFTSAPIFESKFVQVNRRGEPISIHNRASYVTIGICAANPSSPMPNAMLVAHEVPMSPHESMTSFWKISEQPSHMEHLALTRFFPLKFVELSVHSTDKHLLMLKLVNGRSYYLELSAPPDQQQYLFHLWLQLICLLKPPENTKNTEVNVKCKDFGTCHKKDPSPNSPPEDRDNPQDVPKPKTEEEEVTKQTSSNQVPLSGIVDPTEESRRTVEPFHSSLKPPRQETTMQPNNIVPLDTKKSKSPEKRKTRTNQTKQKSGKKLQTSGNKKNGSKSNRLLQILSQPVVGPKRVSGGEGRTVFFLDVSSTIL
ncbi:protein FAM71D [Patagioenas fasciata monilis]|uniref:Protein FAM71D n=1 Tax=Patagioenas fasciata monilis TaxID=372326 RepID=A0A1V4KF34_PATFA|nr:protein FAM71D [Patagioenas fasciata monilis]